MVLRNQIIIWSTDMDWWVWICEMVCHGFGWCSCWIPDYDCMPWV